MGEGAACLIRSAGSYGHPDSSLTTFVSCMHLQTFRISIVMMLFLCVCVCVVVPFILDVIRLVDVPAGVTQEKGHAGFFIHLPSAVLA